MASIGRVFPPASDEKLRADLELVQAPMRYGSPDAEVRTVPAGIPLRVFPAAQPVGVYVNATPAAA